MNQEQTSTVFFVAVQLGLDQLKLTSRDGEAAAREWLRTTGFENIDELNKVLQTTATSWT